MRITRGRHALRLDESDWARKGGLIVVAGTVAVSIASVITGVATGVVAFAVIPPMLLALPFLLGIYLLRRGRRVILVDGEARELRDSWGGRSPPRVITAAEISELHLVEAPLSMFHHGLTVQYVEIILKDGPAVRLDSDELMGARAVGLLAHEMSRLLDVPLKSFDGRA